MDHSSFEKLMHEVRQQPFAHGKRHVLTTHHVHGFFNGHQVHIITEQFFAASDKVEILAALSTRLLPMTCHEAAKVLNQVPFAKDKLAVLEILARLLTDGAVHHSRDVIRETFTFHGDKEKAEDILTRFHGPDPHHHHHRSGILGAIVDAVVGNEHHGHGASAPPAVAVVPGPAYPGYPAYPAPPVAYPAPPVVYPTVYIQPEHHHHGHHHGHHGHHRHGHH